MTGLPADAASMRIARVVTARWPTSLELDLTAEGVETEAQRRALLELGCTKAQGYLFRATGAHRRAHCLAGGPAPGGVTVGRPAMRSVIADR